MNKKEKNRLKDQLKKSRDVAYNTTMYCQTPNCKNTDFQCCHLLPEASQLSQIAYKHDACWINPKPATIFFKDFKIIWRTNKIPSILTFKGFCNPCDNDIFEIIDKPIQLTKEEFPLLAYRAFSYHYWIERFEAKASKLFYDKLGRNLKDVPPVRIDDKRVASSRFEEIEYELQSDNYIRDELLNMIDGSNKNLKSEVIILKEKSEFLYSCAVPLTLDIFMNPVAINWETSREPPKLFFHLLDYKNSSAIILSWHSKYEKFAQDYIGLIKSLSPSELKSTLFAFFSFNNMGLAVNPNFIKSIPIEMNNRIKKEVKDYNKAKKLKANFNRKILGYNIGGFTIE